MADGVGELGLRDGQTSLRDSGRACGSSNGCLSHCVLDHYRLRDGGGIKPIQDPEPSKPFPAENNGNNAPRDASSARQHQPKLGPVWGLPSPDSALQKNHLQHTWLPAFHPDKGDQRHCETRAKSDLSHILLLPDTFTILLRMQESADAWMSSQNRAYGAIGVSKHSAHPS